METWNALAEPKREGGRERERGENMKFDMNLNPDHADTYMCTCTGISCACQYLAQIQVRYKLYM